MQTDLVQLITQNVFDRSTVKGFDFVIKLFAEQVSQEEKLVTKDIQNQLSSVFHSKCQLSRFGGYRKQLGGTL